MNSLNRGYQYGFAWCTFRRRIIAFLFYTNGANLYNTRYIIIVALTNNVSTGDIRFVLGIKACNTDTKRHNRELVLAVTRSITHTTGVTNVKTFWCTCTQIVGHCSTSTCFLQNSCSSHCEHQPTHWLFTGGLLLIAASTSNFLLCSVLVFSQTGVECNLTGIVCDIRIKLNTKIDWRECVLWLAHHSIEFQCARRNNKSRNNESTKSCQIADHFVLE